MQEVFSVEFFGMFKFMRHMERKCEQMKRKANRMIEICCPTKSGYCPNFNYILPFVLQDVQ